MKSTAEGWSDEVCQFRIENVKGKIRYNGNEKEPYPQRFR